jgi:hypothetical protein
MIIVFMSVLFPPIVILVLVVPIYNVPLMLSISFTFKTPVKESPLILFLIKNLSFNESIFYYN